MKKYILICLLIFLTGCATTYNPVPENYSGPLATISDSHKMIGSTKAYFFELEKIDGKSIKTSSAETYSRNYGLGFLFIPVTEKRQVPAKRSILSIRGVTHFGAPILAFGGGNYSVSGDITVNLIPNHKYFVKGKLSESYSAVWLEDAQGNVVSKIITKGQPVARYSGSRGADVY